MRQSLLIVCHAERVNRPIYMMKTTPAKHLARRKSALTERHPTIREVWMTHARCFAEIPLQQPCVIDPQMLRFTQHDIISTLAPYDSVDIRTGKPWGIPVLMIKQGGREEVVQVCQHCG